MTKNDRTLQQKQQEYGKRLASSLVLCALVAAALMVDWMLGFLTTLFVIAGLYEFYTMLEAKGINVYKYFGMGVGMIIPLSITCRFELTRNWEFLFIIAVLLLLILMQFSRRRNAGAIVDIALTIFGIFYIAWFLSFLVRVRYLENGLGLLVTLILITKLGDIGAYLIGSRLGRTPLLPRISPKKSVEGAVGGVFFSILAAFICKPVLNVGYGHLVLVGGSLSILGQLGDLSESLIKRDCQVKDSGNIIPGIGGVLDLVDSLIFTAPVFYFYVNAILA